jgi:hypothetical protein
MVYYPRRQDCNPKLLDLRKNETKDWWHTISKAEKASIALGIKDADKGKLKPNSDAERIYGKWL